MSSHAHRKPIYAPMRPRSPDEVHRASTPLELLFDLVFVVAVAFAGTRLHHGIIENHLAQAMPSYILSFFYIWWAWMNFSWFASAYDIDDVPYRLLVMVQLTGALVLAAGIPAAFDFSNLWTATMGYCIMRVALVLQWYRALRGDPARRTTIKRYIAGLIVAQMLWVGLLFIPLDNKLPLILLFIVFELAVPFYAESSGAMTPWHPEHMIERYGLFTIIVLGETILSSSLAVQSSVEGGHLNLSLIGIMIGGVLIVFNMWWIYFQQAEHNIGESLAQSIAWGYGHYFIFSSAAAVGAGLASAVDYANGGSHASLYLTNAAIAAPVCVYLFCIGLVHGRLKRYGWIQSLPMFITIALIIATVWSSSGVLLTGLILSAMTAYKTWNKKSITF